MLSQAEVEKEQEELRSLVSALDDIKRKAFYAEAKSRIKDPDTYATLNYFFVTGLHHFYLGKWLPGIMDVSIFIFAVGLMLVKQWYFTGAVLILAVSIWELWALFRAQIIVQDWNNKLYRDILEKLH